MKNVFINASMNRNGTTTEWAAGVFKHHDYQTIHLVDYRIDQIGQSSGKDQFKEVIEQISHVTNILIGTPVYWSDMTGYLKTFIDRLADIMDIPLDSKEAPLKDANVILIVQGTAPSDAIPGIKTVITHVARRFHMNYLGEATNPDDISKMADLIKKEGE